MTANRLVPYLTFAGNCREAMRFYRDCLGGELALQEIGETPLAAGMPPEMKNCILHATLTSDGLLLMASDMVGEKGLQKGNAVALMLGCRSEAEIRDRFLRLSDGGRITYPIETTFRGDLLGGLTDRFGHHWLLHFDKAAGK